MRPCDHGQSLKLAKQWVQDKRVFDGESGESYDDEGEHKKVTPEESEFMECQIPEEVVHGDAVEPRPPETLSAPRRSSRLRRQPNRLTYYSKKSGL